MFSGITNQVSSWMKKKQDREVSADSPEGEEQDVAVSPKDVRDVQNLESKESGSPKVSRMEMLGNVKNQMTNWLGGGFTNLRKASKSDETAGATDAAPESPETDASIRGSINDADDEDDSSATGGADSVAPISDEEIDELASSAVSSKALESAKNIGNFIYSAVNKAGKTVSEAGVKIKKSVGETSILGEFNKEQEAFIKQKEQSNCGAALPPWSGCPNEVALKEQCLALATDKKNFVRSPPAGADFKFNYEVSYPVAMATLAEDPNLEAMRFELVPRVINEEKFWRNYFYRVGLICQANELSSMAASEEQASRKRSDDDNTEEREWEKELDEEVCGFEVVNDAGHDSEWKTLADKTTVDEFPDLK